MIFLFNILALGFGLVVVGSLFWRWRADRSALSFWRLAHFSAFTFTMTVAAVDAYWMVNLGSGMSFFKLCTSLVVMGVALITFAFPHLSRAEEGMPRSSRFSLAWGGLALLVCIGAVLILTVDDEKWMFTILPASFVPFLAAIVYGISIRKVSKIRHKILGWGAFVVLMASATIEVWWILVHPPRNGYIFFTLPLAYLYNSCLSWLGTKPASKDLGIGSDLADFQESWAEAHCLTKREREIARGILRGRTNKELAKDLSVAENTARNHIANLYRKLGIQKRLDLVLLVQKDQDNKSKSV